MRTEPCVCGGSITAPSLDASGPYVEAHGRNTQHRLWRYAHEGWAWIAHELLNTRPPEYDPRRRPTAANPCDLSRCKCGASAGVEA